MLRIFLYHIYSGGVSGILADKVIYTDMKFSAWLEAVMQQIPSSTQMQTKGPNWGTILPALGIQSNTPPMRFAKSTFATVYQHPTDPSKLIKITKDPMDARNIQVAQKIQSPNVVRMYAVAPVGKATAMVVDKIMGQPLPYGNDAMNVLIGGDWLMDSAAKASQKIMAPTGKRLQILNQFGRNNPTEMKKLSELFMTLARLEKFGVDMNDFTDNVLDNGQHFVLIDLGQ